MAHNHGKKHVKLAVFGCVKCGRFVVAPSSFELNQDVMVCKCRASHYKRTKVRAPDHVQAYWDAQCGAAHSSYRRRLKHYALPSVHAERTRPSIHAEHLASDVRIWNSLNVDEGSLQGKSPDLAAGPLSVSDHNSTSRPTSVQRQTVSLLRTVGSALISGINRVADVEREDKGKAS